MGFDLSGDPTRRTSVRFDTAQQRQVTFNVGLTPTDAVPITLEARPELQLFTRDPAELYRTLLALPTDQWERETRTPDALPPYYLPGAVVIPQISSDAVTLDPLDPRAFWRQSNGNNTNVTSWYGVGSGPADLGSIKAVRYAPLPFCSKAVDFKTQAQLLISTVQGIASGAGCKRGFPVDVATDIRAFTIVPFLAHEPGVARGGPREPQAGIKSGVLVGGSVHAQITSKLINSFCNVDFVYEYDYTIVDGHFGVKPVRHLVNAYPDPTADACTGFDVFPDPGLIELLQTALEDTLPETVLAKSKEQQRFPTLTPVNAFESPPFDGPEWQCRYSGLPDEPAADTECRQARQLLRLAAASGQVNLQLPKDPNRSQSIDNTINDTRYWRCAPPTGNEFPFQCARKQPLRGHCQFVLPIVGIVAEPDEVRGVPFNEFTDYDQPGLAIFFASFAGVTSIDRTAYTNLCTPPPSPEPGGSYRRNFFSLATSAFCKLPPAVAAPPTADRAQACQCTSSEDCAYGDTCASADRSGKKFCRFACVRDNQCPTGTCYSDIHLCGGAPCSLPGAPFPNCPSWEVCKGWVDNNTPGTCVRK